MLKLQKLPDRTPVRLALTITPALNEALRAYAAIYNETYGGSERVSDLAPAMLAGFLEGDREFQRWRGRKTS